MKIKQSKSFFNFILDKNTSKKQIQYIFMNLDHIHLESIIELIHNLLENNFIKLTPSLKSIIKKFKNILIKFTSSLTKTLSVQKKLLRKHFRLIYYIIHKSKNIILLALAQ